MRPGSLRERGLLCTARRGRYQYGPSAVPRSKLALDCQGESHSVRPFSIAVPCEACMKPASRVCDVGIVGNKKEPRRTPGSDLPSHYTISSGGSSTWVCYQRDHATIDDEERT